VDGVIVKTGYEERFELSGLSVDAPKGGLIHTGERGLLDPLDEHRPKQGVLERPDPYRPEHRRFDGAFDRTFLDDYYNQIHFSPPVLDFGSVSSDTERTVYIWNAHIGRGAALLNINYDEALGLRVEGDPLPRMLPPLGMASYRVVATENGSASIDGGIQWTFDIPYIHTLPTGGTRARLLLAEPAWPPSGRPFRVEHSFSTAVSVSRSGREQRVANRTRPRKQVTFQTILTGEGFRRLRDAMWSWQHLPFCTPEVTRKAVTETSLGPGALTVRMEGIPPWLLPDAQVVLVSGNNREIKAIESVDVSNREIEFKGASLAPFPAGSYLYPGLTGFLRTEQNIPRLTNNVASAEIQFDVQPLSEPIEELPEPDLVFNGREVFLRKPNWANTVEGVFVHDVEVLDYGRGPIVRAAPIDFGSENRRATYLSRNYEEAEAIRALFYRMRGRQGEFYVPSWENDIALNGVSAPTSSGLNVAGHEFADTYADSTVHKAMFVQFTDGTILLRRVMGIEKASDDTGPQSVLSVDSNWGRLLSPETVVMAGWLYACRFVSDILLVEWVTDSVANIQLNYMTLEDLPPE